MKERRFDVHAAREYMAKRGIVREEGTIRNMISAGTMKVLREFRSVRILKSELDRYIKKVEKEPV